MTKTTRFGVRGLCGALAAALFLLGLAHPALAADQPQWVGQLGTADDDGAYGVATDGAGNITIAGYTGGALWGSKKGATDAFVAQYSAAGVPRWKRQPVQAGGNGERANGVATDSAGNVYVAIGGAYGAWLLKYSTAGALRWTRPLGSGGTYATSAATDRVGNAYMAGWTSGSLGGPNQGGNDAFVAQYSTLP